MAGLRGQDPYPHLKKAVEDFDAALARDPGLADALSNRGNVLLQRGDVEWVRDGDFMASYTAAIRDFKTVLKTHPDFVSCWNGLGLAYRKIGEDALSKKKDPRKSFEKALHHANEAVRAGPGRLDAVMNRGIILIKLALAEAADGTDPIPRLTEANECFAKAVKISPGYWLPLYEQSRALEKLGRHESAAAAMEKAQKSSSTPIKRVAKGMARFRAFLEYDRWVRRTHFAQELMASGAYGAARTRFEEAIRMAGEAGVTKESRTVEYLAGAHYNLACIRAVLARGQLGPKAPARPVTAEEKTEHLEAALEQWQHALEWGGAMFLKMAEEDPDLEALRAHQAFAGIAARWSEKLKK
ncbi:MAG: tetratricopeptide repeat protein [Planctomycetota bacterium]